MNSKLKVGVAILLFLLLSRPMKAQYAQDSTEQRPPSWGISTNMLSDLLLSPALKLEKTCKNHWIVSIGGSYGWWDFDWNTKYAYQQWHVAADVNRYLKNDSTYTGHRLGFGVKTGQFDVKRKENARRGHFATAGLLYGYTWRLNDRFYLDAGIGLGYVYKHDHKYTYNETKDAFCCLYHKTRHRFGVTDLSISLIYRFPQKK